MKFETQAQQACYEKLVPMFKELFGEFAMFRDDYPVVGLILGSSLTQAVVAPWGDDDAVIQVRAYVTTGTELTPDLLMFLLQANDHLRFGAFGIDNDGAIFMEHSIVGPTCDKPELKASMLAVAHTADEYDDQIVKRWGGERALDHSQDESKVEAVK